MGESEDCWEPVKNIEGSLVKQFDNSPLRAKVVDRKVEQEWLLEKVFDGSRTTSRGLEKKVSWLGYGERWDQWVVESTIQDKQGVEVDHDDDEETSEHPKSKRSKSAAPESCQSSGERGCDGDGIMGLSALFEDIGGEEAALAWCNHNVITNVVLIAQMNAVDEFINALPIPPTSLAARVLRHRLESM